MNAHELLENSDYKDHERQGLLREIALLENEMQSLKQEISELLKEIRGEEGKTQLFSEQLSYYRGVLDMMDRMISLGLEFLRRARENIHQSNPYTYGLMALWRVIISYITGLLSFVRSQLKPLLAKSKRS